MESLTATASLENLYLTQMNQQPEQLQTIICSSKTMVWEGKAMPPRVSKQDRDPDPDPLLAPANSPSLRDRPSVQYVCLLFTIEVVYPPPRSFNAQQSSAQRTTSHYSPQASPCVLCLGLAAFAAHAAIALISDIDTGAGRLVLLGVVYQALLDVRREAVESLVDVDVALRGDLEEGDTKLVG